MMFQCLYGLKRISVTVFVSLSNVLFERQVLIGSSFCAQMVAVCVADGGAANTHQSDSKSFLVSGLRSAFSFT